MRRSNALLRRFARDTAGATAVEYGIVLALISVFVLTGVALVGTALNGRFNAIAAKLGGP